MNSTYPGYLRELIGSFNQGMYNRDIPVNCRRNVRGLTSHCLFRIFDEKLKSYFRCDDSFFDDENIPYSKTTNQKMWEAFEKVDKVLLKKKLREKLQKL
jgi:hypothetical protein